MSKFFRKSIAISMVSLIFCFYCFGIMSVFALSDEQYQLFEENEAQYQTMCIATNLTKEQEQTCNAFTEYYDIKMQNLEKELAEINKDINNTKKDLQKVAATLNDLAAKIRKIEAEISVSASNIKKLEVNISLLEEQIAIREADITERDNTIKSRLEAVQSIMAVSAFADFIMGAKDFVDLIRRVEGVNDITDYDKAQIKELEVQRAKLLDDKGSLDNQKANLEATKRQQETTKASLQSASASQQKLLAEYNTKAAELEAKQQKAAQNLDVVKKALADISSLKNYKGSNSFIYPVTNFRISAGAFYYPASFCSSGANSCVHLGTDFAASVGTPVVAPANSVVMYKHDGCPTYGKLGTWCGTPGSAGAGNHVMLLMQIKGKTYVMKFGHMSKGVSNYVTWPANDGKLVFVSQGQQIGEIGSSGNSTGPHTHVEIIYFGTASMESVIKLFSNQGLFDFGLGWGNNGLKTSCNKLNYKAPCRYNPSEFFNVQVGQSYSN